MALVGQLYESVAFIMVSSANRKTKENSAVMVTIITI